VSAPRGIRRAGRAIALLIALASAPISSAHQGAPLAEPGVRSARAGTYTLHRIMAAPEGRVLGIDGRLQPLSRYTRDQITLLASFTRRAPIPRVARSPTASSTR